MEKNKFELLSPIIKSERAKKHISFSISNALTPMYILTGGEILYAISSPSIINSLPYLFRLGEVGISLLLYVYIILQSYKTNIHEKEKFQLTLNSVNIGVREWDLKKRTIIFNKEYLEFLGYDHEEIIGSNYWANLVHPDDLPKIKESFENHLNSNSPLYEMAFRIKTKKGAWRRILSKGKIKDFRNKDIIIGTHIDMESIKERELLLEKEASLDYLTGVYNKKGFDDNVQKKLHAYINKSINEKKDTNCIVAMYFDLNDFKVINDNFGHFVGDIILKEFAKKLIHCCRDNDVVGRLGGDEFCIILEVQNNTEHIFGIFNRLEEEISKPFTINYEDKNLEFQLKSSIGISKYVFESTYEDEKQITANILKKADEAMYRNKPNDSNKFAIEEVMSFKETIL